MLYPNPKYTSPHRKCIYSRPTNLIGTAAKKPTVNPKFTYTSETIYASLFSLVHVAFVMQLPVSTGLAVPIHTDWIN